ncbi:thiopeptide-type bacteriocin biosynthesis protein [Micromonospora sp. SH-82]|uniref:thiopeptide-type bacteriocin biosynthesis protein n=1 Tax=Micromonospora sp. SH-82 TaxID=3132938 RepID=UPI003EBA732F
MTNSPWRQITIELSEAAQGEEVAVSHLGPLFTQAEAHKHITAWFFIRKSPQWRLRYLPAPETTGAREHLLESLRCIPEITRVVEVVYEPETHAFGGTQSMTVAHRLFHADSRHVLDYLAATTPQPATRRRRELAILLAGTLLRAAGLDWYEQGDVWSRIARHRPPVDGPGPIPSSALRSSLHHLLSTDMMRLPDPSGLPGGTCEWGASFASAGRDLAYLAAVGDLRRGLRAILTHHVIFAMNRLGLSAVTQAVLATNATAVIFGPDLAAPSPAADRHPQQPPGPTLTSGREGGI